jgi:hypothetical protein
MRVGIEGKGGCGERGRRGKVPREQSIGAKLDTQLGA